MRKKWDMLSTLIIVVFQLDFIGTENNSRSSDIPHEKNPVVVHAVAVWRRNPPYAQLPTINDTLGNDVQGITRDIVSFIKRCAIDELEVVISITTKEADSEYKMIELLRDNKAEMAFPIFELPNNRRYSDLQFIKLTDYPGSEFITTEVDVLDVVLHAVLKAWPLLAITLVLTAIAGVFIWALDTYWNSDEFRHSFIKGSWDGFWWSFISMTTVGYGDKTPKSIVARIFSIIWIMLGLIVMTIFTAALTSALTAHTIKPTSLFGLKVGVLSNGTEYEHALEEKAYPTEFYKIDDLIQALNTKQVDGMLIDRYTASYYQTQGKLKSLITVKKYDFRRDVGILLSKNAQNISRRFPRLQRKTERFSRTIAKKYQLTQQNPTQNANLFDNSLPIIKQFLYISLGVLGCLILTGTTWDIFNRRRAKAKDKAVLARKRTMDDERFTEQDTIRNDLKVTRKLLQDHFDKLEAYVLRTLQDNNEEVVSEERPEDLPRREIP